MNRRTFLRLGVLAFIGASGGLIYRKISPFGAVNYLRWMTRGQRRRFFGDPSVVALGECADYNADLLACLRSLWLQAKMPEVQGKRVLIKPNLVDCIENYPATTAPGVVGAVADLLLELGAGEVIVGDGSAFRRETWTVVKENGLASVLEARKLPFVDLNYDDPHPVPVRDGWIQRSSVFWLPRQVINSDLIVSVAKLKTHHWGGVSLSLKNLLGVVPGAKYGWPKNILHINGIAPSILGIYQILPPVVAVVDGIVGMEGDGPLFGKPVRHGLLAVGRDPVSVDITCAELMGFSAESIEHLKLAAWAGLGQARRIEIAGVPRERLQRKYQPPPFL